MKVIYFSVTWMFIYYLFGRGFKRADIFSGTSTLCSVRENDRPRFVRRSQTRMGKIIPILRHSLCMVIRYETMNLYLLQLANLLFRLSSEKHFRNFIPVLLLP